MGINGIGTEGYPLTRYMARKMVRSVEPGLPFSGIRAYGRYENTWKLGRVSAVWEVDQ